MLLSVTREPPPTLITSPPAPTADAAARARDDVGHEREVARLAAVAEVLDRAALDRRLAAGSPPSFARAQRRSPSSFTSTGSAHRDHEPDGRKYEFGPHRAAADQRRDIEAGAARLRELLGDLVRPISTHRGTAVPSRPVSAWSSLASASCHGNGALHRSSSAACTRRRSVSDWLKPDLSARLAQAIRDGDRVGVMFHHAVMDRATSAVLTRCSGCSPDTSACAPARSWIRRLAASLGRPRRAALDELEEVAEPASGASIWGQWPIASARTTTSGRGIELGVPGRHVAA